jgi:hypothetical protein
MEGGSGFMRVILMESLFEICLGVIMGMVEEGGCRRGGVV